MQSVKADERGSNMLRSSDSEDEPCRSVLNRLESRDEVGRKSKQNAVITVQSRKDECNNKRLEHCSWYLPQDGTQVTPKNSTRLPVLTGGR